jgi:hypothetical protein
MLAFFTLTKHVLYTCELSLTIANAMVLTATIREFVSL